MRLNLQSNFAGGFLRFALGWPVLAIFLLTAASVRDARASLRISEFAAGNGTGLRDEDGEFQDWIEIHNNGAVAIDLLGWSLTDDPGQKSKWPFPARTLGSGKYLVIFASGKNRAPKSEDKPLHTNFKLDLQGEYLALFRTDSSERSTQGAQRAVFEFSPKYPEQRHNYSHGIGPEGRLGYFEKPTPGAQNGDLAATAIAPVPAFSVERGTYEKAVQLQLTSSLQGVRLRYTLDGGEPSSEHGLDYSGPLAITNTTVVRAVALKDGYLASRVITHSYLFLDQVLQQSNNPRGFPKTWGRSQGFPNGVVPADYEMDTDPLRVKPNDPNSPVDPEKLLRFRRGMRELPIVSLVLDTQEMFGARGLYVTGRETAVKQSNEKKCSIEMLEPNGKAGFSATCSLDLHGNASRNPMKSPKHGFKLSFKEGFGESSLDYRLFPDSPADNFDDLILRPDFGVSWVHWSDSSGNPHGDYQRTRAARIRDAWFKETRRDMGGTASYNRFCHLFINGLYWGVYDFTEQPTDSFARNYFGGEKSDYDIYDQGTLRSGTATAYERMARMAGLERGGAYESMRKLLNIPEFIDYTLLHFFVGHQDWFHQKNWYAIRRNIGDPKAPFRFIPWDGENLLLDEDVNLVQRMEGPLGLHARLAGNAEYRLAFADRVFAHMIATNGALTPPANIARWRKWASVLDQPIVAESVRWGDYRRDVHPAFEGRFVLYTRESHWLPEIERVAGSYFTRRNAIVLRQLRSAGLYPKVDAPIFSQQGGSVTRGFKLKMEAPRGKIYFTTDGTDPRRSGSGEISANAIVYQDAPVEIARAVLIKARTLNGQEWSALNEATFTAGESGWIRITKINYHPVGGDAYEFVQLSNHGPLPVDLTFYRFAGINFIFPEDTVLNPSAALLLSSSADPGAFAGRYPTTQVFGAFRGSLDNGGERLSVLDRRGKLVTSVEYADKNGWPVDADGKGAWLEMIDPNADANAPASWRAGTEVTGLSQNASTEKGEKK